MKKIFITIFIITFMILNLFCFKVYAVESENIDQTAYQNYNSELISCGKTDKKEALVKNIPKSIPKIIHIVYLAIQIAVPIVLVVFGSIDLIKGVYAQKDDEMQKSRQLFIKKLISAALIFIVFMAVKLIIGAVADSNSSQVVKCAECFINNDCS